MTPRNLIVLAVTLLALSSAVQARPEFYARPVAQYTWLPASYRKADVYHTSSYSLMSSQPAQMVATDYTASGGGFGAGLSLGILLGSERSFEIGAEGTVTRLNGSYHVYRTTAASAATGMPPLTTHSCSFTVRTALASYRQFFGKQTDKVRPYFGCVLGQTIFKVAEGYRQTGINYADSTGESNRVIMGLGIGVNYRLGKKIYIEAGYRFTYSDNAFILGLGDSNFYRNAHTLNLALSQRF